MKASHFRNNFVLLFFFLHGCLSPAVGPDYSKVKSWCRDKGGFNEGDPVWFRCVDGSEWKRCSHGEFDFIGWRK